MLKAFTDVSKKYHSVTTDVPLETAIAAKMAISKPIDNSNSSKIQNALSKKNGLIGVNAMESEFNKLTYQVNRAKPDKDEANEPSTIPGLHQV